MKNRIDLNVEARETGKANSRELRMNRRVPAVVYGAVTPTSISIFEGDIVRYNTRAHENALFNLKTGIKDLNGKVVLVKSVDVHPLSRRPRHVDLIALDLSKTVRVHVEVRLEGKPIGLSEGGLLNVVARQIEVECLPTEIPEFIAHDIAGLGLGDVLHASDLKIPANVKLMTRPEETLAVVNVQEEEVVATPAADAAAAAPAAGAAAPAAGAKPGAAAAPAAGAKAAAPAAAKAPAAKK